MNEEIAEALILWEDHPEVDHFECVREEEIYETSRWHKFLSSVWQDKRDGSFYEVTYHRGLTEMQDEGPEEIEFRKVERREKTVVVYV